jgi:hypothetical protein
MSETWKRRFLLLAGLWNIVGGLSALADPAAHFAQLYRTTLSLDDPLQTFFFRATWINVIAWGVGYILAARWPAARGPVLIAGAAGKCTYFAACIALFASGVGTRMLLGAGLLDPIMAAFFVYVVWSQGSGRPKITAKRAAGA